ncbi:MAG TPA: hypothetical protein VL359_13450 [bacterium]|nr:hypothetical protein [bacterium]
MRLEPPLRRGLFLLATLRRAAGRARGERRAGVPSRPWRTWAAAQKPVADWVVRQHRLWQRRLDRLEEHLRNVKQDKSHKEPKHDRKE